MNNDNDLYTFIEEDDITQRTRVRRRGKSSFSLGMRLIVLAILLLLCSVVAAAAGLFEVLPRSAVRQFGPPNPAHSSFDRFVYTVQLYLNQRNLIEPADPSGTEQEFEVGLGESVNSVAARLQEDGLIRNGNAFKLYLIYSGLDLTLQAGKYQLSPDMSAVEIAQAMQDATPETVSFTILPGWRSEEIAEAFPTSGLSIRPEDFFVAVNRPDGSVLPASLQGIESLEGFLMPATYNLPRLTNADELVSTSLQNFLENLPADYEAQYRQQGLSLFEAVTLASMVEREAVVEDEQPLIASVFYNRLDINMKLDSDPTVQYAVGYDRSQKTWWKNPLTTADLQVNSPYNTYLRTGLPPGPISNPGPAALRAVAYPADSPYFYFRASCDNSGSHLFAVTYEEHLANECE